MKRFLLASGCCLLLLGLAQPRPLFAQDAPDAPPADAPEGDMPAEGDLPSEGEEGLPPEPPAEPAPSDADLAPGDKPGTPGTGAVAAPVEAGDLAAPGAAKRTRQESWKDVVVLPRKAFLKRRRVEFSPMFASTINDNLIQHTAIGGELNYFITDILSVGVLGMYYFDTVLDQEFFTRYHFGLVPTLNKYNYTATFNMAYVPIYGKFSLFNYWILHYEVFVTGGVGITGTEVIPRKVEQESFKNIALTFPIGAGGRLFLTRWLALQVAFRDFMMLDKFEEPGRTLIDGEEAKDQQSESRFINNFVFNFGVSVYLPLNFEYTTFR